MKELLLGIDSLLEAGKVEEAKAVVKKALAEVDGVSTQNAKKDPPLPGDGGLYE